MQYQNQGQPLLPDVSSARHPHPAPDSYALPQNSENQVRPKKKACISESFVPSSEMLLLLPAHNMRWFTGV